MGGEGPTSRAAFCFYTGQAVRLSYYSDMGSVSSIRGCTILTEGAIFLRMECVPNMVERDNPDDEIFDLRFVFQISDYGNLEVITLDFADIVRVEAADE